MVSNCFLSMIRPMPGIAFHRIGKKTSGIGQPTLRQCLGPLIKRCPVDQTQQTQEHVSEQKHKKSE